MQLPSWSQQLSLFSLLQAANFSLAQNTTTPTNASSTSVSTYINPDVPTGTPIVGDYAGRYRPQVHFSPPTGFMNDPNGMFRDANGTWHLYYQLNPTGVMAGNQHWGHATSDDLYHWVNQPIALFPPKENQFVFSGSAVVDVNNTSGFFPNQENGVVAIYVSRILPCTTHSLLIVMLIYVRRLPSMLRMEAHCPRPKPSLTLTMEAIASRLMPTTPSFRATALSLETPRSSATMIIGSWLSLTLTILRLASLRLPISLTGSLPATFLTTAF